METVDPELQAMQSVANTLYSLQDDKSRMRVLNWVADKLSITLVSSKNILPDSYNESLSDNKVSFTDFIDLFDAVNPSTDLERTLIGAYWLQIFQGSTSWQSYQINNLLKDVGHGVKNITKALEDAQNKKPALVRQISKSGKSKQSRKTYKLTIAGINHFSQKINISPPVSDNETN